MKLSSLLLALKLNQNADFPDIDIESIVSDSRQANPSCLFVCIPGSRADGHRFVGEAVKKGALVIVCEKPVNVPEHILQIQVSSSKEALSILMQQWTDYAWKKMQMIAVTGTTAKTTIAFLVYRMLNLLEKPCAFIGTAGLYSQDEEMNILLQGPVTTPQPQELHPLLKQMHQNGCEAVSMEASSFGLAEKRLWGMQFDLAILSNLSFNHHIGFHGSWEDYLSAKRILFQQLKPEGIAILNSDDAYWEFFRKACSNVLCYGSSASAEVRISDLDMDQPRGIRFNLHFNEQIFPIQSELQGFFQAWNIAAAFAVGVSLGYSPQKTLEALTHISHIPGRWDEIYSNAPFKVIVDKANTPLALESIRNLVLNPSYCHRVAVFGNVGGGDYLERVELAKLLIAMFDHLVLTQDDPEDEDIWKNFDEFLSGLNSEQKQKISIEPSRKAAFSIAVDKIQKNGLLLILGRGNQKEFICKGRATIFNDVIEIQKVLHEKGYLP